MSKFEKQVRSLVDLINSEYNSSVVLSYNKYDKNSKEGIFDLEIAGATEEIRLYIEVADSNITFGHTSNDRLTFNYSLTYSKLIDEINDKILEKFRSS